jgi:hypothetical protein
MGRMIPTILPPIYCSLLKTYFNSLLDYSNGINTLIGTIAPNAALNVVPTPRAGSGELAPQDQEPAGAE